MKVDKGYTQYLIKDSQAYQAKQLRLNLFEMIIDLKNYRPKKQFDLVMTPRLSKSIYKMINQYCDKNDVLSQELINVVLINNPAEIEFFKAFGGFIVREDSQHDGIIINPMYFKKQINRLKEENAKLQVLRSKLQVLQLQDLKLQDTNDKLDKLEIKKLNTIQIIDSILIRSISEVTNLKEDVFKTGQQILRNFSLEDVVVEILVIQQYSGDYKNLFNHVIKFLEKFAQDNYENQ